MMAYYRVEGEMRFVVAKGDRVFLQNYCDVVALAFAQTLALPLRRLQRRCDWELVGARATSIRRLVTSSLLYVAYSVAVTRDELASVTETMKFTASSGSIILCHLVAWQSFPEVLWL